MRNAGRGERRKMDWITGIQKAIDYVEAHITEPIDYEEAAKRAYSSSIPMRGKDAGIVPETVSAELQ